MLNRNSFKSAISILSILSMLSVLFLASCGDHGHSSTDVTKQLLLLPRQMLYLSSLQGLIIEAMLHEHVAILASDEFEGRARRHAR